MQERPIDRLSKYLEFKGISASLAEKRLGVGNAYIQNSKNRKGEIGSAILNKISEIFLDVNLLWIITGKGEMQCNTPLSSTENIPELDILSTHSPSETNTLSLLHTVRPSQNDTPTISENDTANDTPTHDNLHPTRELGMPKVVVIKDDNSPGIALVQGKASAGYLQGYGDPEYIQDLPTIKIPGLKEASHRAFEVKGHSMSPTLHDRCIVIGCWVESLDDVRDRRIYIVVTKEQGITVKRVLNRIFDRNTLVCVSDNSNKQEYPNFTIDPEDILELWELKAALQFEFTEIGELYTRFNNLEANITIMQEQIRHLLK